PRDTPVEHGEAERRQITALSSELVGLAPGAGAEDLEDLREAVGEFRRCLSQTVSRHNGFLVRHVGNSALVLFGYPMAHEYDAEQAVRAALELCAAVRSLRRGEEVPLRCRVGIATGIAIVGDPVGGSELPDDKIVGDAPNLAAQLQVS